MDNLKIEVPGKPAYLSSVRLAIGSIAAAAGFDLDAAEDIKTAVTEACKNVSCHGIDGFSDKYEVEEMSDGLRSWRHGDQIADDRCRHREERQRRPQVDHDGQRVITRTVKKRSKWNHSNAS